MASGPVFPRIRKIRHVSRSVATVMPEIGFDDEPVEPEGDGAWSDHNFNQVAIVAGVVVDDAVASDDGVAELFPLFGLGAGAVGADRDEDGHRLGGHPGRFQFGKHRRNQQMVRAGPGRIGDRDADGASPERQFPEKWTGDGQPDGRECGAHRIR